MIPQSSVYNTVNLSEIAEINMGKTPSRNNAAYWGQGNSWISIADLNGVYEISHTKEEITDLAVKETRIRKVSKGTILFSFKLSIGKVAITGKDIYTNEAIAAFAIKDNSLVDRQYLYYVLKEFDFTGTGDKAVMGLTLNQKKLKVLPIPIPPLETQKKIAEILDKADALRQQDKKIIEKYDQLTQSVFLDMFGDPGINSKNYENMKLKEVCTKITDGTHHSPPLSEEGFPYVTAKHIKSYGLNFDSDPTFIAEEYHVPIYKRCNPENGDILYIKDGATTGIAALNTFDCEISLLSSLALLKPNYNLVSNYYLIFWLNNERVKNKLINSNMSGAAIKRYTLTKINEFDLLVPPLELQNHFAEIIKKIEKQKQLTQKSLEKSEQLFQSFLQRAFKGELV